MSPAHHIALSWLTAFNAHNLDALLALYNDEAVHYSPKLKARQPHTQGLIKGKEALQEWWQEALERLPSLHYEPQTITANGERAFMEYIRQVAGEEDMPVAEVLEINDGLIIASRVYHG